MIQGEKIRLRLLEREDLIRIANWRNLPEATEQFFSPWPITYSEQGRWYEQYLAGTDRMFIIEPLANLKAVGMLALVNIDRQHQRAELGRVMIDPDYCGQGYARDAVKTLIRFAFGELNLQRLYIETLSENVKAIHLYDMCGFRLEGKLRQHVWKRGLFRDVTVRGVLKGE